MESNRTKLKGITFFIDEQVHNSLAKVAEDTDRSLSSIVRRILHKIINNSKCLSPDGKEVTHELIIKEILDTDFSVFSQESLEDLRRVSDEGGQEIKAEIALLFQDTAV